MSLDSLQGDVASLADLGDKQAGHLIKHNDWNTLVQGVAGIGDALLEYIAETDNRVETLEGQVTPLIGRVDSLVEELADIRTEIAPLLDQYVITMSTVKVNYALGELCEITAEVRDLSGEIVTTRPWVDFITTWGQMREAPGFSSEPGASGSSISVRTNTSGIARVLVKSAHTEHLTEIQELQVDTAMKTTLSTGEFFYQTILDASTPVSEPVVEAFNAMSVQYQQVQSSPVQAFIDSYQQFPQFQVLPQWNTGILTSWTKYRAIVVAFAKDDSDPRTPDAAKGTSSIQITFRDWVRPWIDRFVKDYEIFVPDIMGTLAGQLGSGGFAADLELWHQGIASNIGNMGIVARQRYYNGVGSAVDKLTVPTPPAYLAELKQTIKNAVTLQQIQESPSVALEGTELSKTPGLAAVAGVYRQAAAAKDAADNTVGLFSNIEVTNRELTDKINFMGEELRTAQQVSTEINTELSAIGQNVLKINTLDQNSVQGQINLISAQIGQIGEVIKRV